MKKLFLILSIVMSSALLADEIPVPNRVVMFNNPTLNGVPFAAIFAHDYKTSAEMGGVNLAGMANNSARFICYFLGYDRVYTYAIAPLKTESANVLFVDESLVANPVETTILDGKYNTSIFTQIGCYRIIERKPY